MGLILASSSPRRRELIQLLGVDFEVIASRISEDLEGLSPIELAETLAIEKALAVFKEYPGFTVIGADTVIDLDGEVLGKPADQEDARRILRSLRARSHQVITGVAIIDPLNGDCCLGSVTTEVRMKGFSSQKLREYVRSGEPMDKAGAYAIQGMGGELVASLSGCYYNVIGFPLCLVAEGLARSGVALAGEHPLCRNLEGEACPRLLS